MVYAQHWGMKIFTALKGEFKGQDELGNCYYQERFWIKTPRRTPRRWVMYKNMLEGSTVTAEWFGWLRQESDHPLDVTTKKSWQKVHEPNKTGTDHAYRPSGCAPPFNSSHKTPQDYEPWRPS